MRLELAGAVIEIAIDDVERELDILRFRVPTSLHLPERQEYGRVILVAREELEVARARCCTGVNDRLLRCSLECDFELVGLLQ